MKGCTSAATSYRFQKDVVLRQRNSIVIYISHDRILVNIHLANAVAINARVKADPAFFNFLAVENATFNKWWITWIRETIRVSRVIIVEGSARVTFARVIMHSPRTRSSALAEYLVTPLTTTSRTGSLPIRLRNNTTTRLST